MKFCYCCKKIEYSKECGYYDDVPPEEIRGQIVSVLKHVLKHGMSLDDWKVTSMYVSNEDEYVFYCYLYDRGLDDNEWLKSEEY